MPDVTHTPDSCAVCGAPFMLVGDARRCHCPASISEQERLARERFDRALVDDGALEAE